MLINLCYSGVCCFYDCRQHKSALHANDAACACLSKLPAVGSGQTDWADGSVVGSSQGQLVDRKTEWKALGLRLNTVTCLPV